MARLPSPRHPMYCSLRISGLRAGDDSPLRTLFHCVALDACGIRQLQTQRLRPCGLNVTSRTRCNNAKTIAGRSYQETAAMPMLHHSSNAERAQPYTYDAVRLELQSELIARNAAQCAFCSSGMLLTGYELLSSGENLSRAEIREFIS